MMRVNEILNSAVNNVQKTNNKFDVQKWAEEKKEKRKWAYKTQDEMATKIIENGELYKTYLDVQSKFSNYSVGNALLIMAQNPKVTQLKDVESWKKDNITFGKKPTPIIILEPSNIYERDDGTEAQGYDPKNVYDISDMRVKRKLNTIPYTSETIMKAVLSMAPVEVEIVTDTFNNKIVNFNIDKRRIEVAENAEVQETIQGLVREIASIHLSTFIKSDINNFRNESIAYMVSKRFGLPTDKYNFEVIPEELKKMTPHEIKNELSKNVECFEILIEGMEMDMDKLTKAKINKEYER